MALKFGALSWQEFVIFMLNCGEIPPEQRMKYIPSRLLVLLLALPAAAAHSPRAQAAWDSVKAQARPVVSSGVQAEFGTPYRLSLADYGWEDGLHISRDGRALYALYAPADLLAYNLAFSAPGKTLCELLGNMVFIRPYAKTYGMDMETNAFGCDSFMNIDILYAHRNTPVDTFKSWQLSGIARPGAIEGGPAPLASRTSPDSLDLFLFSGDGDMWMIRNTPANPDGIANAVRLPSPPNPVSDEFNMDNAHVERLGATDTLVMVYEKYTDAALRDFMYTLSQDNGVHWSAPVRMTTVDNARGHIEHPHLFRDPGGQWWFYYSINYEIHRSRQMTSGNWDSWSAPELVIGKGNCLSLGEPSLTTDGSIAFLAAYENTANDDSTDRFDLDPWFLPNAASHGAVQQPPASRDNPLRLKVSPNPFTSAPAIRYSARPAQPGIIKIYTVDGEAVFTEKVTGSGNMTWDCLRFPSGVYIVRYSIGNQSLSLPIFLRR